MLFFLAKIDNIIWRFLLLCCSKAVTNLLPHRPSQPDPFGETHGGYGREGKLTGSQPPAPAFYVLNKTGLFSSTLSRRSLSLAVLLVSSTTKTIVSVVTLNGLNKRKRNNTLVGLGESEKICNITFIQAPYPESFICVSPRK